MRAAPALQRPAGGAAQSRLAGIEGVRGLAALSVLLYHTWRYSVPSLAGLGLAPLDALLRHLWLGVTVFFVLSGFLLYRPFAAASIRGTPRPSVARYALARILRIVPAYYAALTVFIVAFHRHLLDGGAWPIAKNYLFLQLYFPTEVIIGPAWTLCVEVTFYAVLPLLAWAVHVYARGGATPRERARRHALGLAPLLAVGLGYQMAKLGLRPSLLPALPGYLDQFGIGMLLAVLYEWRGAEGRRAQRTWPLALAGLALGAGATLVAHDNVYAAVRDGFPSVLYEPLMAIAFALLLASVLLAERPPALGRLLTLRAVSWLGLISYGVYLWHEPFVIELNRHGFLLPARPGFYAANVLIVAPCALLAAWASWRLVERRALALKHRRPGLVLPSSPRELVPMERA